MSKKVVVSLLVVITAVAAIVVVGATMSANAWRKGLTSQLDGWEKIESRELGFSAQMPTPVTHERGAIPTPFGEAPLDTYSSSPAALVYTIAVSQYDPRVAKEFSREQRLDSTAEEMPKALGGKLVRREKVERGGFEGQEIIVDVPDKGLIRSRSFLVGDRAYQLQIVYLLGVTRDSTAEQFFFDSFAITQ